MEDLRVEVHGEVQPLDVAHEDLVADGRVEDCAPGDVDHEEPERGSVHCVEALAGDVHAEDRRRQRGDQGGDVAVGRVCIPGGNPNAGVAVDDSGDAHVVVRVVLGVQVALRQVPLDGDSADEALQSLEDPGHDHEEDLEGVVYHDDPEEETPAQRAVPSLQDVDDLCVGIPEERLHRQVQVGEDVTDAEDAEDGQQHFRLGEHGPDDVAEGA
mmetsp:Transcript_95795/g.298355  ORF Transcript_95795/g.298355 Transcript_95795/m.298355 type:complete len:213 (+) Transcript_95795:1337-1975(+)